jgi:hypothetical protein
MRGLKELSGLISHLDVLHPTHFNSRPKVILHDLSKCLHNGTISLRHLREGFEMHDSQFHIAIN